MSDSDNPIDDRVSIYECCLSVLRAKFPEYFDETHELYRADRRYKACENDTIVVLIPTSNTVTNEKRNVKDKRYAKYRGSEFFVENIFFKITPNDPVQKTKSLHYYSNRIVYETGKTISESTFDTNIDIVCSHGIHYFLILETAFSYGLHFPKCKLTGWDRCWHDNGQKSAEHHYVNGELNTAFYWHDNGQKSSEHHYVNCEIDTEFVWYDNGNKQRERQIIDGVHKNIIWYENGQKKVEFCYDSKGKKPTNSQSWDCNGILTEESKYHNDDIIAETHTTFHPNGKIKCIRQFNKMSVRQGLTEEWTSDGTKIYEGYYSNGKVGIVKVWNNSGILEQEVTETTDGRTKHVFWDIVSLAPAKSTTTESTTAEEFNREIRLEYFLDGNGRDHGNLKEWKGKELVRDEEYDHGILIVKRT